jgi:predicted ATPase
MALLLRGVRVDPSRGGERIARLPFLSHGPVALTFRTPVTFLVGENGSGKTTLLEAIAAA